MTAPGARLRVEHLMAVAELSGAELLGGAGGLGNEITEVGVVYALGDAEELAVGTLAVAALRNPLGYELEVLARTAHRRGLAGLVTTASRRVLGSTRRMCDRLALPLIAVPGAHPIAVAAALARHVHDPAHLAMTRVLRVVRQLPAGATPARILEPVREALGAPVALLGRDGGVLTGSDELVVPDLELPTHPDAVPLEDGGCLVLAPVTVDDPLRPDLWVAAKLPPSPPVWRDGVVVLLRVVAFAVAAATARDRMAGERDARDRSTLAAELMDPTRAIGRSTVERALRMGWRLDGWHTGVHLRPVGNAAPLPSDSGAVRDALRRHGLAGAFAERADGWVLWTTTDTEPPATGLRAARDTVAAALADVVEDVPLVAGIGRPHEGRNGIATTLHEASEASLFAGSHAGRVEHVDGLGVRRHLARWQQSEAFTSYATGLLAPLAGQDVLLETLIVYLDRESSATSTASHLGVHRNTVNQRIERVQQVLDVDLARADDRLVVQLACRVLRGAGPRL